MFISQLIPARYTDAQASPHSTDVDEQQGRPIGGPASDIIADLRFQRDVERVWQLGPRALHELILEAGRERMLRTYLENKFATYAAINPDALAVTGGDGFAPMPVRAVGHEP